MAYSMRFMARRSEERGNTENVWLKTFHTFSFATYQDDDHQQFGPLRVINEDRVAASMGFGTNTHREFEIFSYIVSGELEHTDSMGNVEILKRGSLQLTSSGTGVSLCDDVYGPTPVHFLQIWSLPSIARLTPQYFTRYFSDAEKTDQWVCVVAPKGSKGVSGEKNGVGPAPVQSPLTLYATILGKGKKLEKKMSGKKGYVHVLQTQGYNSSKGDGASVRIIGGGLAEDELLLREGDGAYLSVGSPGTIFYLENTGSVTAEILLLDLE